MAGRGRPRKNVYINVKEFSDMVKFIQKHPVDRTNNNRESDVPIPLTGESYWNEALNQVLDCLSYIDNATPMTEARRRFHDVKISKYSDERLEIYEYVRTQIIENNGGSSKIYERSS